MSTDAKWTSVYIEREVLKELKTTGWSANQALKEWMALRLKPRPSKVTAPIDSLADLPTPASIRQANPDLWRKRFQKTTPR